MNAKAELAHIERQTQAVRALTAELRADNDAAERNERHIAHANLERELRRFVQSHKSYGKGGVCKLLRNVAGICEELSQVEGDDWQKAAMRVDDCADACDLEYAEPPHRTDCDDRQTQAEAMKGQR